LLTAEELDGRFADEAVAMLLRHVMRAGSVPSQYEAKIFGGGNQFAPSSAASAIQVPRRNVEAGLSLLSEHGFGVSGTDLGGYGPRQVALDLSDGRVTVHRPVEGNGSAGCTGTLE
jgi:chemotaxis protein CheD